MELSKAIEILSDLLTTDPQMPPDDRRDAVRLGIEALDHIDRLRKGAPHAFDFVLPGETKEKENGFEKRLATMARRM